jgi:hypothetical protein
MKKYLQLIIIFFILTQQSYGDISIDSSELNKGINITTKKAIKFKIQKKKERRERIAKEKEEALKNIQRCYPDYPKTQSHTSCETSDLEIRVYNWGFWGRDDISIHIHTKRFGDIDAKENEYVGQNGWVITGGNIKRTYSYYADSIKESIDKMLSYLILD